MSKITWFSVIVAAIAIFITGWNQASLSSNLNSNIALKADHNLEIQSLEAELNLLKAEESELQAKKNRVVKMAEETYASSASSIVQPSVDPKSYPLYAESLAEIDRINALYKNNPDFDMDAERDKIFMAEPIDKTWAGVREESLLKAFQTDPQLQGKAIKAIECRSKHCRIEIFYQDLAETGAIAQYVYGVMGKKQYNELFVGGGEMKISQKDKVLGIYVSSDPKVRFF